MQSKDLFKIRIDRKSILAFIVAFFITTNYIYQIVNPVIYIIAVMILLCGSRPGYINLSKQTLFMILFAISITFGGIFTPAGSSGRVYMITTWCLLLITLRSTVDCSWVEKLPRHLLLFSGIQSLFVLLYPFLPEIVQAVAKVVLTPQGYAKNLFEWNRNHIDCGITAVQSLVAFYVTIFLSVTYAFYANTEKKEKNRKLFLLMYILAFVALLYTSKRGAMIANVAALLIMPLLLDKKISKKIKYLLILSVVAVVGYGILAQYFPQAIRIFTRFQTQEDISTGRFDIYQLLLSNIGGDWLFGKGNLSVSLMLNGNYGHNIYIQLFYENGILGCLSFLLFSIYTFVKTTLNYRKSISLHTKKYLLVSFYFQVYFLIYGLFGNPLFDYTIYFTYVCMLVVGMYGERLLKYEDEEGAE